MIRAKPEAEPWIQRAMHFVECNPREEIRVDDVASAFSFSTSHFHAIFGKVTGCTLAEHVRKRPIDRRPDRGPTIPSSRRVTSVRVTGFGRPAAWW